MTFFALFVRRYTWYNSIITNTVDETRSSTKTVSAVVSFRRKTFIYFLYLEYCAKSISNRAHSAKSNIKYIICGAACHIHVRPIPSVIFRSIGISWVSESTVQLPQFRCFFFFYATKWVLGSADRKNMNRRRVPRSDRNIILRLKRIENNI